MDDLLSIERQFNIPKLPEELLNARPKPHDLSELINIPKDKVYFVLEVFFIIINRV